MRFPTPLASVAALCAATLFNPVRAAEGTAADEKMLRAIYTAALTNGPAYEHLRELTTKYPGRLAGSKNLEGAVQWGEALLKATGADRTELQPAMVPHWERGAKESIAIVGGVKLTAVALGGSVPTPAGGLRAPVVEVQSLAALKTTDVKGKIVFFNRPMNPEYINPGLSYRDAGDQRNQGPGEAAKYGAVGALVRSLTHAHDDVPHTGATTYPPDGPKIPAAALSTIAADNLSAALKLDSSLTVEMTINSRWFEDAPSHNVIGELRGSEHPEQIIVVGGHLDAWDIAPGAHDDGSGVVQSIEVMRLLKAAGYQPRHTLRVVLFTNEENGTRGATAYSTAVQEKKEQHLFALETDNGGFQPRGFNLGNPAGNAARRAARWRGLFEPYGIYSFSDGVGGTDVHPLLAQGTTVAGLTPDSQRYFDIHHTTEDSIDKVNPRELELGAAAMASLIYLVDQYGL
ncbi:Zn-dependent amino-or carboxypeptidase, M28 family [Opitutus sp. GAS368]|jgi:carboxypeptidase Q|nr:Zn-dependent amino-or carboxypeptidase, M28 family [Opitutus sp. GAS368]